MMPQQLFLPGVLQLSDSWGIWGFDPGLALVLAFIAVPISLAMVFLALDACGRLLRGGAGGRRSATSQPKHRFQVIRQLPRATQAG
jgi:hypothetical protein